MSIFSCLASAESKVQKALAAEWAAIPQQSKNEVTVLLEATNVLKIDATLNGQQIVADITKVVGQPLMDDMLAVVDKVAASLGINVPAGTSAIDTFGIIAKALAGLSGNSWEDKVLGISVYFISNLVGAGAIARTVAIPLVQWVYDNVIKPALTPAA